MCIGYALSIHTRESTVQSTCCFLGARALIVLGTDAAGKALAPAQRADEYGLRARSETTNSSASSTKFMTTEEPP
jgi:hypothetical protein